MAGDDTPAANPPANPSESASEVPPPVTPVPEPPNPPATPAANPDTNSRMDRMESILTTLTETVSRLIPSDDKPVKRPWTHAGMRRRDS